MPPPRSSRETLLEYRLPLLAWLCLIYFFSSDSFSAGETSRIIEPLLRFLFPFLSGEQIVFWHGVIRKLSHVTEYAILAALAYRAIALDESEPGSRTFALVFLVALCDEFHQSMTQYRGASMVDVVYDCLGGVVVLGIATRMRTTLLS